MVLAAKKDGTKCFCIDFHWLNNLTKKDVYPLSRIEECLDALNGCQFFSSMDLASGYWQVAMTRGTERKPHFQLIAGYMSGM